MCLFHAGLAVADEGARVYIVGGRAQLKFDLWHPCTTPRDSSAQWITAEVFELDLGQKLLGSDPLDPTARWRQVRYSTAEQCIVTERHPDSLNRVDPIIGLACR